MATARIMQIIKLKPQQHSKLPWIIWLWVAIALVITGCEDAIKYLPPLPKIEESSTHSSFPPQSRKTAQIELGIEQSINKVRQNNGLPSLKNDEKLAQIARKYSRLMAEKKFFSHTAPDGSTLKDRVQAGGILYWMVGENLFKGTNLPQPVAVSVEGWLESPGHRANILRPVFTETGVGVWRVDNTYYITQLFLRR